MLIILPDGKRWEMLRPRDTKRRTRVEHGVILATVAPENLDASAWTPKVQFRETKYACGRKSGGGLQCGVTRCTLLTMENSLWMQFSKNVGFLVSQHSSG